MYLLPKDFKNRSNKAILITLVVQFTLSAGFLLKNIKSIQILSLLGALIIMAQLLFTMFNGDGFCLNAGCELVEKLTIVPPAYLNVIGLFFFLTILMITRRCKDNIGYCQFALPVILLSGLAAEGVLTAFQYHIAQSFCAYCLIIFALILLMNVVGSLFQAANGVLILTGIYLIFSLLNFKPSVLLAGEQSLSSGTYGSRSCTTPQKELFLIFSEDCPHCHNVINALRGCNSCDFHFNPVELITKIDLPELKLNDVYSPEVNKAILSLLEIKTVPVLLVKNSDGFDLIKGENAILDYIEKACFHFEPTPDPDAERRGNSSPISGTTSGSPPNWAGNDEGCSISVDCDSPEQKP